MTKIITQSECEQYFQEGLKSGTVFHYSNETQEIIKAKHSVVSVYSHRIQLRPGLLLQIGSLSNRTQESYGFSFQHPQSQPLTLAFTLGDDRPVLTEGIQNNEYYFEKSGENCLFFLPNTHEIEVCPPKAQLKSVRIFISPDILCQFSDHQSGFLPQELNNLLEAKSEPIFHYRVGKIREPMNLALTQILNCSYEGMIQKLYLESKVLELIALQFTQLSESCQHYQQMGKVVNSDIERIYQARDILIRNFQNPPSLLELSRQVGLNDYKLKRGFRQVFNTSVYKYLQAYRMEKAKELLKQPFLSIGSVAQNLGYTSQSRFCDAFKKYVGMTPRDYKNKS